MILLFKLILLTVIIVLALKIALSEKMILEKLGKKLEAKVEGDEENGIKGQKIWDLIICPWCAGTLQSITAHFFAFGLGILPFEWTWQLLIRWPLVVFGASFISGTLWTIVLTLNQIKDRNEQEKLYFERLNEQEEDNGKSE